MKKIITTLVAVGALSLAAFAADFPGVNPAASVAVINSTTTTNTGAYVNSTNTAVYPCYITSSTTFTNVIPISLAGTKDIAVQFSGSDATSSGGAVTIKFGRNVQGGSPTNAPGTGLNIEPIGTLLLTLPASTAETTSCTNWWSGSGALGLGGAIGQAYIISITVPANVVLTNYFVYVSTK